MKFLIGHCIQGNKFFDTCCSYTEITPKTISQFNTVKSVNTCDPTRYKVLCTILHCFLFLSMVISLLKIIFQHKLCNVLA